MSIHQQSDDKFLDNLETEFVFDIKKYGPHSYPRWLEIEKEKRAIIAEPEYYISGISLTFLKPDGKEHTYKYYPFRKKKLTLEDFARVVPFGCQSKYGYPVDSVPVGAVSPYIVVSTTLKNRNGPFDEPVNIK